MKDNSKSAAKRGPPSAENPCDFCGSHDHFIRDCPKRQAADDERRKKREAAKAEDK